MRIFGDREMAYLQEVMDSGVLGWAHQRDMQVDRFEREFAAFVGADWGIARNSAMTGLAIAVAVADAGVGDEVLCDSTVHFGAVAAVAMNAIPRFVDIDPRTWLMDPESLRANISEQSKAVIVTNLWGQCAALDEIRAICDEHDLFMIEDCAHSLLSYWDGQHSGTFGDLGVFSFQQGKQLPTGDGGMMVTDDPALYQRLYDEWAFSGESPAYMVLNYRMNEMTAAVGRAQLERVAGYIATYNESLAIMEQAIEGCAWLQPRLRPERARVTSYAWSCLWDGDRYGLDHDRFRQLCAEHGAAVRFGFNQVPPYQFDFFRVSTIYGDPRCPVRCPLAPGSYDYRDGLCPNAEHVLPRLISANSMREPESAREWAEHLRAAIEAMERA